MDTLSIPWEELVEIYAQEQLPPPALLTWPLSDEAEARRVQRAQLFDQSAEKGHPSGLEWMDTHAAAKYHPPAVLPDCHTILVSALGLYRDDSACFTSLDEEYTPSGTIACYARGRDYHKELGGRIRRIVRRIQQNYPETQCRGFSDIGPLDEVWLAQEAGLGFRGRHGLAILPEWGTWVALAHVLWTGHILDSERIQKPANLQQCPPKCQRCIEACPTSALHLQHGLEPSKCLSYLTIERPGPCPEEWDAAWGNRLFGCDSCQEACPFNASISQTKVEGFLKDIAGAKLSLQEILKWKSHADVVHRLAGSPLMRAGRSGLVRNACVLAANSGDQRFIPLLKSLLDDEDEGVRVHAGRSLARLEAQGTQG